MKRGKLCCCLSFVLGIENRKAPQKLACRSLGLNFKAALLQSFIVPFQLPFVFGDRKKLFATIAFHALNGLKTSLEDEREKHGNIITRNNIYVVLVNSDFRLTDVALC